MININEHQTKLWNHMIELIDAYKDDKIKFPEFAAPAEFHGGSDYTWVLPLH